jgi:hypothetical protein
VKHYLIAAAILLFGLVYFATNRYELAVTSNVTVLRDKWTGEIDVCTAMFGADYATVGAKKHIVCHPEL